MFLKEESSDKTSHEKIKHFHYLLRSKSRCVQQAGGSGSHLYTCKRYISISLFLSVSLSPPFLYFAVTNSPQNRIEDYDGPKWLTFNFHTTSQFRILNSEFRNPISEICTKNFGIRNCEIYVMWTSAKR